MVRLVFEPTLDDQAAGAHKAAARDATPPRRVVTGGGARIRPLYLVSAESYTTYCLVYSEVSFSTGWRIRKVTVRDGSGGQATLLGGTRGSLAEFVRALKILPRLWADEYIQDGKPGRWWKAYRFNSTSFNLICRPGLSVLRRVTSVRVPLRPPSFGHNLS